MVANLELYHHGIKGQKWGVRRFQNQDGSLTEAGKSRYNHKQRRRDMAVYGNAGARRIEKRINKGASVSEARSYEADRIYSARRRAMAGGQIGSAVGTAAGAIGGFIGSKYVSQQLTKSGNAILNDPQVQMMIAGSVSLGASQVGATLGRTGGRALGMISGGYSPSKYR